MSLSYMLPQFQLHLCDFLVNPFLYTLFFASLSLYRIALSYSTLLNFSISSSQSSFSSSSQSSLMLLPSESVLSHFSSSSSSLVVFNYSTQYYLYSITLLSFILYPMSSAEIIILMCSSLPSFHMSFTSLYGSVPSLFPPHAC